MKKQSMPVVVAALIIATLWGSVTLMKGGMDSSKNSNDDTTRDESYMPITQQGSNSLPDPTSETTEFRLPLDIPAGNAVLGSNSIVYQTINRSIVAYDVSDPANPAFVAKSDVPGFDDLYSTQSGEVYAVREVTTTVQHASEPDEAEASLLDSVEVVSNTVALTSRIVVPGVITDVSYCDALFVSSIQGFGGILPSNLIEGIYIYERDGGGDLEEIGSIKIPTPLALTCSGDLLFVSSEIVDEANGNIGDDGRPVATNISVYDITDVDDPVLLDSYEQPDRVNDLAVSSGKLLVGGNGLTIYTVSGQGELTEHWSDLQGDTIVGVDVDAVNFAYSVHAAEESIVGTGTVTTEGADLTGEVTIMGAGYTPIQLSSEVVAPTTAGLRVVDLSEEDELTVTVDIASTRDWYIDVAFAGDIIYALDWFGELASYEYDRQAETVTLLDRILLDVDPESPDLSSISATEDHVVIVDYQRLTLVDVSNPASLDIIDEWAATSPDTSDAIWPTKVEVLGSTVAVTVDTAGTVILEIESGELVYRSLIPPVAAASSTVMLHDDVVLVSEVDGTLVMYDLQDLEDPVEVDSIASQPSLTEGMDVNVEGSAILVPKWGEDNEIQQIFLSGGTLSLGSDIVVSGADDSSAILSLSDLSGLWFSVDGLGYGLEKSTVQGYSLGSDIEVENNPRTQAIDSSDDAYVITLCDHFVVIEVDSSGAPTLAVDFEVAG
ncbi:MAG: hypothetical protein ACH37Z_02235 [Anaerolineae bacterium]